ncbi:unnamed protein product [Gordionus sp. m RMFG-2023]|uniref:ubiquitin carboxyl-terminal hydrolase 46-like n=1 Tax=Gordionus sp. m RMFG-2023 TaxID=3053472 RepID=UPI0030E3DB7F
MGNLSSNHFDKLDYEHLELFNAEKYFGLVNFGNTCYCNSVLQALYFCKPFRERLLLYKLLHKKTKDTILASLGDLFFTIASQKKTVGSLAPKKFITRLRKEYENFNNYLQQDAHEFLNYLLNDISETLTIECQEKLVILASLNQNAHMGNHISASSKRQNPFNHAIHCTSNTISLDNSHVTSDISKDQISIQSSINQNSISNSSTEPPFSNSNSIHNDGNNYHRKHTTKEKIFSAWAKSKASFRRRASHAGIFVPPFLATPENESGLPLFESAQLPNRHVNSGIPVNPEAYQIDLKHDSLDNHRTNHDPDLSHCNCVRSNAPVSNNDNVKKKSRPNFLLRGKKSFFDTPYLNSSSCSANRVTPPIDSVGNTQCNGVDCDKGSRDRAREGASGKNDNFVNEIFRGQLAHETRCLNCESISSTTEVFFDISVDVGPNTSITSCLRSYSNIQTLLGENKYECKTCNCKQEAQRRTSIKKLPVVLALHLKRFKMDTLGQPNKFTKVSFKVIFPLEIRLPISPNNSSVLSDELESSRLYELIAIIVHCGTGLNRGHYISIVKSLGNWLLFDDDVVETIDESSIQDYFGVSSDHQKSSDTAYILFYQALEWRSL